MQNVDLVSTNMNPDNYVPNFSSDFLPSNSQAMNGSMPDALFYGNHISNSIFKKLHNENVNTNVHTAKSNILNPYYDASDHSFKF